MRRLLPAAAALLLLACHPAPGAAQSLPAYTKRVDAIAIADSGGRAYGYPFLGGLDRPRPQLVDIDGDGDLDLFIQEFSGRMTYFERTGAGKSARWVWRTDRWLDLDIGEWSRFVDVDGDGDIDVLAEAPYSYIRWYRNDGGPKQARFTIGADTVRDVAGQPIFADRQNIPQLADLDCDGRLDLMLGRVDGTITRFEMRDLHRTLGPRFVFVTDRFEDIQILGGDAGPGQLPTPATPVGPSLHGANTMAIADLDRDGDQDILWGDFFEPGLLWIRNEGSCSAPSMRGTPVPFPGGDPIRTSGYNAPAMADLDGDGDADLLVGVLGGAYNPTRTARDNLYLLEQAAPGAYAVRSTRVLDGLDLGSESVPALADLDGDGDLDLLVGNKIEAAGGQTGGLYFLENTGSAKSPAFRERGRIEVAAAYHYAPALGDLDGDGDLDLVLGTWRNQLLFYRNAGSRHSPRFVLADSALVTLTRGSHASPALADLDGDGDLDLLVGEASGSVNYYRNDGGRAAPRFTLVSDEWEGISGARRSAPRPVDLDGDGDFDVVIGVESGRALLLRNTGSRTEPRFAHEEGGPAWPPYTAPAFGDLDADGDLDLILGNASGGLVHLENGGAP
jgi:hypothetical protein